MKSLVEIINEARETLYTTTWEKLLYALREANDIKADYLDPKNIGEILMGSFASAVDADASKIKKYSTAVFRSIMKDVELSEEEEGGTWLYKVIKGAPGNEQWSFLTAEKLNL